MSVSYPGSELSVEQLLHALVQAVHPSSPTSRRFVESGLQKVLDVERKIREVLQATKATKNTFKPVNRLPLEILSNVLEQRASNRDLITATHVCRHWRSTLTSTPSLWTNLQFREPTHDVDRALTYLKRSKSVPIDIEMDLDEPQNLEVAECLAPTSQG